MLPGHGPGTTIGRERRTNPFLVGLLQGEFDPAGPQVGGVHLGEDIKRNWG